MTQETRCSKASEADDRGGPRWLMWQIAYEDIEDVEFPDDSHATSTGISNPKLAMWVYLASDALLFGGLISTYLIYKNRPGEIPGLSGSSDRISGALRHPVHLDDHVHPA